MIGVHVGILLHMMFERVHSQQEVNFVQGKDGPPAERRREKKGSDSINISTENSESNVVPNIKIKMPKIVFHRNKYCMCLLFYIYTLT